MDPTIAYSLGAVLFGGAAAFLAARETAKAIQGQKRSATAVLDEQAHRWAWILLVGCRPLKPIASKLLSAAAVEEAAGEAVTTLKSHDLASDNQAIVSLTLLAGMILFALISAAAQSLLAGAATFASLAILLVSLGRSSAERRRRSISESVPSAIRSMSVCFRAGLSLIQTLRQTGNEVGGLLGQAFERTANQIETGTPTSEALDGLKRQAAVPELAFATVALDVQHQSGGSVSRMLDIARESLESELELQRNLRVQTAQAKLSARIITIMPFLMIALFSIIIEGFLDPFFESWAGAGLLALALSMQALGIFLVRKMLRIEES